MKKLLLSTLLVGMALSADESVTKMEAKYGTWPSPITSELVSQAGKRFGPIVIDNGTLYWEELRPKENGRTLISSEKGDMTPQGYSVRTRVYEYGGKSFTVENGVIYFVNDKDQRIYVQKNAQATALTAEGTRYGDLYLTKSGLIAVGELHQKDSGKVDNFLALIDLKTGDERRLATGFDFYSSPALSPDGKKLAWLSWNLPNMPWDGCELWVADFKDGTLVEPHKVAGGLEESIFQPQWGPDGKLYFISDKSGWWNLYRGNYESLCPMEAEFGAPQWVLGMSTYAFWGEEILCTYFQNGSSKLARLNPKTKALNPLDVEGTSFAQIRVQGNVAAFLRGSPNFAPQVVRLELPTMKSKVLAQSAEQKIDPGYFSLAQPVTFPSRNGRVAYGFYYPPKNRDYVAPKGELPPLIVKVHGGPTSQVTGTFSLGMQFWTSRGYAVLDVNYGGSSGYGRTFRNSLNGNWGIVDVEDAEAGAEYLVSKGLVDKNKLAITGGSAGGYTTLAAMTFGKTFQVGASYFGISDLVLMQKETHKYEAGYLETLIAPFPAREDLFRVRSPIDHLDSLTRPVIFLQGAEDKIVPPNQAELLYDALKKRGILTKLILYPGEGHGFRKAENIKNSFDEELSFYTQVFK